MKKLALCLAMGMGTIGLLAGTGGADDKKPAESTQVSDIGKAVLDLSAAHRMVVYGREKKSPEALIAAARVIGTTNLRDFKTADDKPVAGEEFDAMKMAGVLLEEAAKLGGDNDAIKTVAATVKKEIAEMKRGAVNGPQVRNGSVGDGDGMDTFAIRFRGGQSAIVIVNNRSNQGDIDLFVENDNGQVVARDAGKDDDARVQFYVPKTATYYVKIKKFGSKGGTLRYTMMTD